MLGTTIISHKFVEKRQQFCLAAPANGFHRNFCLKCCTNNCIRKRSSKILPRYQSVLDFQRFVTTCEAQIWLALGLALRAVAFFDDFDL
jgi:hypothetical protein